MRLLLDTHALLWWLADDPALSVAGREAIANPANEVFVSAVSANVSRAHANCRIPVEEP